MWRGMRGRNELGLKIGWNISQSIELGREGRVLGRRFGVLLYMKFISHKEVCVGDRIWNHQNISFFEVCVLG